jgi:hypothetical protein
MALESCSTCGYALPLADSQCRHCVVPLTADTPALTVNLWFLFLPSITLVGGVLFLVCLHFVS